ncbi:hypothetical protein BOTBODRAFT_38578 [Botryobasidium botryosum FD-172 SS1]|uniref:Lysosomal dipeptide transporter MFSD1 n=1 Tax=Botryobasidium botryosum (strain FD-172 SS1) TaxID=930990 RepID=A0A067M724_BOTB1|nr:hypothetical protein BOTBODRAFT_38578 [Botryobasidium botryosum FD-172 SS1]
MYPSSSSPRRPPQPSIHTDLMLPSDDEHVDSSGRGVTVGDDTAHPHNRPADRAASPEPRAWMIRGLALLCACSLSIGSHYGSYFLGPLKSRLNREIGTSNTEFSLLIASYNLNNTWTPLVGGLIAARLGTAFGSILATGLIFLGQFILLVGDITGSIRTMALGLFIFGFGVSPLAVVQETIIVRFFSNHGLGVSLAFGLVAGKGASFVSAITSVPLSENFGPHAPFIVSTALAGTSFGINLIYVASSQWLARGAGIPPEESELRIKRSGVLSQVENMSQQDAINRVAARRKVKLQDVTKLGDVFWVYIAVNVLCGAIWSPFTHLAANIIEQRYDLSELEAGSKAALLLAGSIVLYPICGYITDRLNKRPIVHVLLMLSSVLTLICYFWLALPPGLTETPVPGLISFGLGHGFSPLLLVLIVPHIVPIKYVSTVLGAHKSLEQAGSTIAQTLSGLILDKKPKRPLVPPQNVTASTLSSALEGLRALRNNDRAIQLLLDGFLLVNVLQLLGTAFLWQLDVRRKKRAVKKARAAYYQSLLEMNAEENPEADDEPLPSDDEDEGGTSSPRQDAGRMDSDEQPLLPPPPRTSTTAPPQRRYEQRLARSKAELKRGKIFAAIAAGVLVFAWVFFLATMWFNLRSKKN